MTSSIPIKEAWKFCPRCGQASEQTGCHPFHCNACDYSHYFSPFSAVGAIITDNQDRMFLIVRGREPGKGKLGMPGGFIDPGERAEEALIREVYEETGLQVNDLNYLASFPNHYAYAGIIVDVTDMFFTASVNSFDNIEVAEGEIDGFRFVDVANLSPEDFAFPTHQQALTEFIAQRNVGAK